VLIGAYLFKRNAISDLTVFDWTGVIISGVICATAIFLLIQRFRKKEMSNAEKIIIASSIIAFLIHVSVGSKIPTVHPRYMAYFLILLFGMIISSAAGKKYLQILIFIILVSINAIGFYRFYDRTQNYIEPWREIAQAVNSCIQKANSEDIPIVADNSIAYPVAFYLKNSSPFYTIPLFTKPDQKNTYSTLHFFGHLFRISLFHYTYYPVMGQASLSDLFSAYRKGIALYKGKCYELIRDDLKTTYGSIVRFDMIQEFNTNQGTVIIFQWNTIK
jgi:Zn-dependent protease with chaperone function